MKVTVEINGGRWNVLLDNGKDVSIPVAPGAARDEQPECFGLPAAVAGPFTAGSFVAAVSAGASINCPVVSSMCAHSNGTHTECVGHALPETVTLADVPPLPALMPALLLSVHPEVLADREGSTEASEYPSARAGDHMITASALQAAADALAAATSMPAATAAGFMARGALVVRTLPNDEDKRRRKWTGSNPPYFTRSGMAWARAAGVQVLCCDLPSVDREDDAGLLIAHRTFWELPPRGTEASTTAAAAPAAATAASYSPHLITEICYIPAEVPDGVYVLNLQVAPIKLDAAPSRPVLYPVVPV